MKKGLNVLGRAGAGAHEYERWGKGQGSGEKGCWGRQQGGLGEARKRKHY